MLSFRVQEMTCGHCARRIAKAIHAIDEGANVEIDIGERVVCVSPKRADAAAVAEAIEGAGYTPVAVEPAQAEASSTRRAGCGCGC